MAKQNTKKDDTVGTSYAKSAAGFIKQLSTTFPNSQKDFAAEIKATCGDNEREAVVEYLKGAIKGFAKKSSGKKKTELKSVK